MTIPARLLSSRRRAARIRAGAREPSGRCGSDLERRHFPTGAWTVARTSLRRAASTHLARDRRRAARRAALQWRAVSIRISSAARTSPSKLTFGLTSTLNPETLARVGAPRNFGVPLRKTLSGRFPREQQRPSANNHKSLSGDRWCGCRSVAPAAFIATHLKQHRQRPFDRRRHVGV